MATISRTIAEFARELDAGSGGVSTTELNKLDGVTATTAELNKLDGVTATTAELNALDVSVASGASATTFLRGDATWQTAGSTSATDLTSGTLANARLASGHITDTAVFLITNETIATTSSSVPDYFTPSNIAPTPMTISMGSAEKLIVRYAGGRACQNVNHRNCLIVKITDGTKTEIIKGPCFAYGSATAEAAQIGFIVSGIGYSGTTTVSLGVQSLDNSNAASWIANAADPAVSAESPGVYVLLQIYTPS